MEIPHFDGTEALGWIFKSTNFSISITPRRINDYQLFLFTWMTQQWGGFIWIHNNNNMLTTWANFLLALQHRFGPSHLEDPQGELFKLQQTTIVRDYCSKFETLSNKTIGVSPHFLLRCFISGLKPHGRRKVQALQPYL